jgi:GT2 family glycosyltransferase
MTKASIPITAAVTACKRVESLLTSLRKIASCEPPPAEILVHLDGNSPEILDRLRKEFPTARLIGSDHLVGPGGGRNRLTREAKNPWIAHFDDDSFPETPDYFAVAAKLIASNPEVAVWSATIISHEPSPEPGSLWLNAVHPGCGHLMSQAWFAKTSGYLPLTFAYNLEEVDVSLQLHALGAVCVQAADLKVWHDHPNPVRETPDTEVLMMINTILFPLLRYPLSALPQGILSILRRAFKLSKLPGGLSVLARTAIRLPATVRQNFHHRKPLPSKSTWSWLFLRRERFRVH